MEYREPTIEKLERAKKRFDATGWNAPDKKVNAWKSGSFYLAIFVVIIAALTLAAMGLDRLVRYAF